jgi:hypothetical protein
MLDQLGKGNRDLFLDIYPMYRFYQDQGWAKFSACRSANAKVTDYAYKGFEALARGDGHTHLAEIANHEQLKVLQPLIYDDWRTRRLLQVNEATVFGQSLPGASPAALTFAAGCDPGSGATTWFRDYGSRLYDTQQRMDWILNGAAPIYEGSIMGRAQHLNDLRILSEAGRRAGGGP